MAVSSSPGSAAVDAYLAKVPTEMRAALEALRTTIREAAPEATETISYGIPAFQQNGILVYYAAFRDHCSLFPGSVSVRKTFATELKPFQGGKGTVHFTPDRPLPTALVQRIVRARVAENRARAKPERDAASHRGKRSR